MLRDTHRGYTYEPGNSISYKITCAASENSKSKVQGVPQSQTAAFPRHQEEEETDKSKQAQIDQTYEKH